MIAAKLHHRARQPELLAVLGIVGAATLTGAAVVSRRRSIRRGAPGAPPIAKAGNSFVSPLIGHELNFSGHRFHILESARDTDDGSLRFDYTAPPGVPHAWWNPSDDEEVRFLGGIRPGLDVETWLETVLGLMRDGKTIGPVPRNPLQLAVLAREVGSWLVLTPVENVLFVPVVLLAFVGRLLGYRARYPEYGGPDDQTAPIR